MAKNMSSAPKKSGINDTQQTKFQSDVGVNQHDILDGSDVDKTVTKPYVESRLVGHIKDFWQSARRARTSIDDRLLFALRSRRGEYSDSELNSIIKNGGADPVFLKMTGTKCRAASSWIRDIILPAGERPWSASPTTEPKLSPDLAAKVKQAALQEIQQMVQQGLMPNPQAGDVFQFIEKTNQKVQQMIKDDASLAADAMTKRISEKMDEGNWDNAVEDFIEDFVTYPTAFFKGPYFKNVHTLDWGPNYQPIVKEEIQMHWSRVSPFDMYPSPHAINLRESDLIERLRLTRQHLWGMIGLKGYDSEQIKLALEEFEQGNLRDWIWEDFQRAYLENDTSLFTSEPETIDALHYWGVVPGSILIEWGLTGLDEHRPYDIDAILINNHIIRAVINDDPLGMRPYHHACWDAVPGSIWGVSLPEQMEDHQKVVNSCARALCTNMSIASGPQVMVLTDHLAEGEDVTSIYPMKIWQMKSSMTGNSGKPVDWFQPSINSAELMEVLNAFEQKADDVTNVPRYSYGNDQASGAGQTASGLSMLMNSAAKGIRRAISSIDANVIRPTVYQAFIYLMLNDPDPTIKGDCRIVPRGATALLIKDQMQVRIQTFLQQTANPIDAPIIGPMGRAKLLRAAVKLLDLPPDIVPTDDELKAQQIQAQQAQQAQQQIEQQQEQAHDQEQSAYVQAKTNSLNAKTALLGEQPQQEGQSNMVQGAGNDSQMAQNQLNAGIT